MNTRFVSNWQLVNKQSLAHWRTVLSVVFGVLIATTIMSGMAIYFDSLRELALDNILAKYSDRELNILQRARRGPISHEEYQKIDSISRREVEDRIGWAITDRIMVGRSETYFLTQIGNETRAGKDNSRAYFAFSPRLKDEITIVRGKFPADRSFAIPGEVLELEAIIPLEVSELFRVDVGDKLLAVSPRDDDSDNVVVRISGIFERTDNESEFWYMEKAVLNASTGPRFRTMPFHIAQNSFLDLLGPYSRRMSAVYGWMLVVDEDRINADNAGQLSSDILGMQKKLFSTLEGFRQTTQLQVALQVYDQRLFFSRLPMFVVFGFIELVAIYYIIILSGVAVEARKTEIGLLRSRGATYAQILAIFVTEGITITLIAIVLGPILAMLVVGVLGFTPAFTDLTNMSPLPSSLSLNAYFLSSLGGLLAFTAVVVPAIRILRHDMTHILQQSARPHPVTILQRYYVDVIFLIVTMFLLYQLQRQGSVLASDMLGYLEVNQLFMLIPGLMSVAAAAIIVRLFPLVLKLCSLVLAPLLPVGFLLAIWQVSRNSTRYSNLVFLLALTAGLGVFASSFEATLDRSFRERILFSTGSDIRIESINPSYKERVMGRIGRPREKIVDVYEKIPGVDIATPVLRVNGRELSKARGASFTMLAVDPEKFGKVAWFRDDFTEDSIDTTINSIAAENGPRGIVLPENAKTLLVRVKPDRAHSNVRITARVMNQRGQYYTYPLGNLSDADWSVKEVALRAPVVGGPLTLTSIRVHNEVFERNLEAGSLIIDNISVRTYAGGSIVIDDFKELNNWNIIRSTSESKVDGLIGLQVEPRGSHSALFSWGTGRSRSPRGIFHGRDSPTFKVLASKTFVEVTGHSPGDPFEISISGYRIPVVITHEITMFPTVTNPDELFLVANWNEVKLYVNLAPMVTELLANELWIDISDNVNNYDVIERINEVVNYSYGEVHDRRHEIATSKIDPLITAGWKALLFIAFSAVLLISSAGFLLNAYMSFTSRRFQFGLLRTLGISLNQLMAMVWLEQTLVIISGLALGTCIGASMARVMLPFLAHDDFGGHVMPPYEIGISWDVMISSYSAMLAMFYIIVVAIVWLARTTPVAKMMRSESV